MTVKRSQQLFHAFLFLFVPLCVADAALAETVSGRHETVSQATVSQATTSDGLWIVSTRRASYCHPSDEQTSHLRYWRSDSDCRWQPATLSDLLSTDDPNVTTMVYVHENRVTRSESFQRAHAVFDEVSRVAGGRPFRLIVISWPADQISCRPRPDIQAKAQRSQAHGYYLAWLLDQMNPETPVALFGNSFGPRMITTALHYLGGGSIHGNRLANRVHPDRRPVRVALMAAALDAHWLSPGQHHGNALTQVEQMLILVNSCDKALRWYPRLYGRRGPHALGYVGLSCDRRLNAYRDKIVEWNVSGYVGRTHSWTVYEGSPLIMATVVPHLFGG